MNKPVAPTFTIQRALLATVGLAILAGMIPAGLALDRRLADALQARAREDLSLAPRVLADRNLANADMMMMHAKEFAHADGLADALARNDRPGTLDLVNRARNSLGLAAIVVGPDGKSWTGPTVTEALIAQTRDGKMPVVVQREGKSIRNIALAPVVREGKWVGAAGLLAPIDESTAGVLSGLTRSAVLILSTHDGMVAASTLDTATTREIVAAIRTHGDSEFSAPFEIHTGRERRLVVSAPLGDASEVVFTRALSEELAVLPDLRRGAFFSALGALIAALLLGALFASRVARPVRQLAMAAQGITDGEFTAALPITRIREVQRMSDTFNVMRETLAARLSDLQNANSELVDRSARLSALQSDLMQRDRLAATGRLVSQLAHEIRNPVANLRNCLELIRRRVTHDVEAREFADLAIDELLRMHELAEQMLDLNRPRAGVSEGCHPSIVAREVAVLASLGNTNDVVAVTGTVPDSARAQFAPDALKQVLINLVQNAREAWMQSAPTAGAEREVEINVAQAFSELIIEVRDRGPGIPAENLARIFDPFFTTKLAMHGVGLGLFVAEGLVRSAGGSLSAGNRSGGGAWFRIELPAAHESPTDAANSDPTIPATATRESVVIGSAHSFRQLA
ncbi:MAG: HAMP domain-containing sensor histidine kinase [Gemmatimonas sp.]